MWWRKVSLFVGFALVLFVLAPPVLGEQISYFPFSGIRKGMKAVGKTVLYGTRVEGFSLEVIDVVQAKDITDSYFVVLVTDDKIKNLGGILAGMSGSPVYVRNRIAGALSHSFETQDHLVGVVTPIEAMLKIWQEEEALLPLQAGEKSVVFLIGMGERAGNRLARRLGGKYALRRILSLPRLFSGGESEEKNVPLEAGSAIGVQLATGDAEVVSIGTLTLRDGDRFLALGHPFLHRGRAQYFLSSVYVNFSLKGDEFPFKVGTPLGIVGVVEEDRSVGIAGRFGVFPETTRVTIGVKEGTKKREFHFSVVQDEDILMDILPDLVLDAIDRTIDRQSPGSVDVKLKVVGADMDLKEEFFWVGESDIASLTSDSVRRVFEAILHNPHRRIRLEEIVLDVEVFPEIQRGWIISCDFPRLVRRGGVIEGKVSIFLYRQGIRDISLVFTLPPDFLPGEAEVAVRGRGGGEGGEESKSFVPEFGEHLTRRIDEVRSDGVEVEVLAKAESLRGTTYTKIHLFLPFVLEGSASVKTWVN